MEFDKIDLVNLVEFDKIIALYINDPSICELDPLVKMAIIHHEFINRAEVVANIDTVESVSWG